MGSFVSPHVCLFEGMGDLSSFSFCVLPNPVLCISCVSLTMRLLYLPHVSAGRAPQGNQEPEACRDRPDIR